MSLCADHQSEYSAWLDYKSVPPLKIHTVGVSLRDAVDSRRFRADDHYALVKRQTQMIVNACAAQCTVKDAA